MKTKMLMAGWFMAAILISVQSCKDDEEESAPEFVASDSDFENFRSWNVVAVVEGANPALGDMAHGGQDELVTRTVYVKNDQDRASDGKFPVGTLVVKESKKDGAVFEMTAMVKRGNNFNPDNNDWEWFMLNEDGTIKIAMRGAKLMDGMCGMCHSGAKTKDFVFSK
jgi:hypothetical protein